MTGTKNTITIRPDFGFYLVDGEGVALGLANLRDKRGIPVDLPGMDAWAKEIEPIVVFSETGRPYNKDWADYHHRGLELARLLRRRLSSDYELWYKAPFEDKSGIFPNPIKIEDVFEPVKAEEGGCYVQWVNRDDYKTEELLLGILYFNHYAEDGSTIDTYTIYPGGIYFEAAGFGPGPWNLPEEDICMRITKEQYDVWVSKIEGLKKSLFALADGHTYDKDRIDPGDVIMTENGYFQALKVHEAPLCVKAKWLSICEYGIGYYLEEDDDNDWVEDPDELKPANGGQHVEAAVFDRAVTMAKDFTKNLTDELVECVYES